VHDGAVLAITKTGVDFPSRKRPTLSFLSSLGPLEGILQLPARLLVEREQLRPILHRDLPENLAMVSRSSSASNESLSSRRAMKLSGPPQSSGGEAPPPPVQTG
jgi:hypothetical protein